MRVVYAAALLVLGAAVAAGTVLLHTDWWGMVVGLAATIACLLALPRGWWARPPYALGWVAVLFLLIPERAEGDYLIGNDLPGYLLLAAGVPVVGFGVSGLMTPRPSAGEEIEEGADEPSADAGPAADSS